MSKDGGSHGPDKGGAGESAGRRTLRAFSHRNYRLFFFGQGVSQIGSWMQRIAQEWLVYDLTNSPFMLGVVGFCGHALTFVSAPFAGVMADRIDRRPLLMVSQAVSMVTAFVLAILTFTGAVTVWHIIVLALIMGLAHAFEMPVRHSFVVEMVDGPKDLPNAIVLNSFLMNGAKLIGPALAGVIVVKVGEAWCFTLNGVSYLAVLLALLAMTLKPRVIQAAKSHPWHNLKEGFAYVSRSAPIRSLLLQLGLVSLLGMSYTALTPVFAKDILHGGAETQGLLRAAGGVGAIFGALLLASRKSVLGLGRVIVVSTVLFGGSLVAFAFSRNLYLSLFLLALGGAGSMTQMAACNTLIQTIVDDDKRGRVMSFYAMALMGMHPFGNLLAGSLASTAMGGPGAVVVSGVGCILTAAVFVVQLPRLADAVHPIYILKGVIPAPPPANGEDPETFVAPQRIRL